MILGSTEQTFSAIITGVESKRFQYLVKLNTLNKSWFEKRIPYILQIYLFQFLVKHFAFDRGITFYI